MANNLSIGISKDDGIWFGALFQLSKMEQEFPDTELLDKVDANSFGELMMEIGNKGWVDLLNKNQT